MRLAVHPSAITAELRFSRPKHRQLLTGPPVLAMHTDLSTTALEALIFLATYSHAIQDLIGEGKIITKTQMKLKVLVCSLGHALTGLLFRTSVDWSTL